MADYQTWRELLAALIQEPREEKRIAKVLGVDPGTLRCWTNHEANPELHQVRRLLQCVSEHQMLLHVLIAEEFDEFELDSPPDRLPVAFSAAILDLQANAPDESRFWSICTAVLSEAVKQLDPQHLGIWLSVVQCMAPIRDEKIRYLRECISLGTSPWLEQVEVRTSFGGAESLAGHAISSGHVQVVSQMDHEQSAAILLPEHAVSAAAFPIVHGQRIAGCLLVASTSPHYFDSSLHHALIQSYAALITLAFAPENFFAADCIALQVMPPHRVQQPYLSTLHQRILATLKAAFSVNHTISYLEAQQYVWWQIAEELAQL